MEINATLIGQLITFAILVWFIMKYVWPPINKGMLEREKKIAAGLEAAERSKKELETAEQKVHVMLREAKVEASEIVDRAHKRTMQMLDEAKNEARTESSRIIKQAQEEIAREIAQTKDALRKQLATLAVAAAEKIIQKNLDVNSQNKLLDEFATDI